MQCECGWTQDDSPWYAHHHHHELDQLKRRMDKMSEDQAHLEAGVAADEAVLTEVEAEIAALKAQPGAGALDFTSFDAFTARLKGDEPAPVAPVDTPPADGNLPTA